MGNDFKTALIVNRIQAQERIKTIKRKQKKAIKKFNLKIKKQEDKIKRLNRMLKQERTQSKK